MRPLHSFQISSSDTTAAPSVRMVLIKPLTTRKLKRRQAMPCTPAAAGTVKRKL
jgi:hypothetical protein